MIDLSRCNLNELQAVGTLTNMMIRQRSGTKERKVSIEEVAASTLRKESRATNPPSRLYKEDVLSAIQSLSKTLGRPVQPREIAAHMDVVAGKIYNHLNSLRADGTVKILGKGVNSKYTAK